MVVLADAGKFEGKEFFPEFMLSNKTFVGRFPLFHDAGIVTLKPSSCRFGRGREGVTEGARNMDINPENTMVGREGTEGKIAAIVHMDKGTNKNAVNRNRIFMKSGGKARRGMMLISNCFFELMMEAPGLDVVAINVGVHIGHKYHLFTISKPIVKVKAEVFQGTEARITDIFGYVVVTLLLHEGSRRSWG